MNDVGLGQRPWMTTPEVSAVLDALEAAGGAECARFVGGCVRNALINRPISDVDIATTLTPDAVTQALQAAGIKAVPTGAVHGTITAVAKGKPIEVTTLRQDVSTDGRRAVVAFTTDWATDAERRDFTLNALYADRLGGIIDPTGQGIADARAGRIVFVGQAATRIAEDSLRILRFFRFLALYGKGKPDSAALEACALGNSLLSNLPAERVSAELLKLLAADDPRAALALMKTSGVLTRDTVTRLFGIDAGRITDFVEFDPGCAIKFTITRLRPSGGAGDPDIFGAQQYAPLLDIDVPMG